MPNPRTYIVNPVLDTSALTPYFSRISSSPGACIQRHLWPACVHEPRSEANVTYIYGRAEYRAERVEARERDRAPLLPPRPLMRVVRVVPLEHDELVFLLALRRWGDDSRRRRGRHRGRSGQEVARLRHIYNVAPAHPQWIMQGPRMKPPPA